MAIFDEQLNRMESLLGQIDDAGTTGSGKPKVKMTAAQAQAGVRSAPSTAASQVGKKGLARTVAGTALKGATKFGGAPILVPLLLWELLGARSEGREYLSEVDEATRPPTAEEMLDKLDADRRRRSAVVAADQNDPEMMESLRWLLSGNERPNLTPNQVMFGGTPTTDQVPPEAIREALAAMTGEA